MTGQAGTYHWMAVEVMKGLPYDESVDIYSLGKKKYPSLLAYHINYFWLGVIIWEVLTGEILFSVMRFTS